MAPTLYPSFTPTYHHDVYPAIDPTQPALSCSGKIVFITGAGQGIGKAIAVSFAKAHARGIALVGRTKATLDEAAAEVKKASNGATEPFVAVADITSQDQVDAAMDAVVQHFQSGAPDVLVNNAGGNLARGTIRDVDVDMLLKNFELNVGGPLRVLQALCRAHAAHSSSSTPRTVINIPSGIVHTPYAPGGAAYASSKLAMTKLTEYVHWENPGWRVFNMQPGVVDTELARAAGRKAPDKPEMPAGCAVWLATSPVAEVLNGRFLWANWDVDEILERKDEIRKRGLLTLSVKGWAEDVNGEALVEIAKAVSGDGRTKEGERK